jgi:hypothetical protein
MKTRKNYRKLRVGEYIKSGDLCNAKDANSFASATVTLLITSNRLKAESWDGNFYYRLKGTKCKN